MLIKYDTWNPTIVLVEKQPMPTGLAMALGITAVTKAPFFEAILLAQHSIVVPIQCLSPRA